MISQRWSQGQIELHRTGNTIVKIVVKKLRGRKPGVTNMNVKKETMLHVFKLANHSIKIQVGHGFQMRN